MLPKRVLPAEDSVDHRQKEQQREIAVRLLLLVPLPQGLTATFADNQGARRVRWKGNETRLETGPKRSPARKRNRGCSPPKPKRAPSPRRRTRGGDGALSPLRGEKRRQRRWGRPAAHVTSTHWASEPRSGGRTCRRAETLCCSRARALGGRAAAMASPQRRGRGRVFPFRPRHRPGPRVTGGVAWGLVRMVKRGFPICPLCGEG